MADRTRIEWTDITWNPVSGCTRISEGCRNCYIDRTPPFRMNGRFFRGRDGAYSREVGATTGVTLHPERLAVPLRKRSWRGKRVFVCSSADLFHDAVPDEYIARVFAVMALTPEVTYQVLTKRPARMRSLLRDRRFEVLAGQVIADVIGDDERREERMLRGAWTWDVSHRSYHAPDWPLLNVWLGVSAEDQATADLRIPALLDTPAAIRWVSAEPLLERVWLPGVLPSDSEAMAPLGAPRRRTLDWVVVGGESGPGCRPMDVDWARSLRDQCAIADVPFFMKQIGGHPDKRDRLDDLPEDLRIRDYPKDTP